MDVIARCVFAMTIHNLGEKDDTFMAKANEAFNFPTNKSPLLLLVCKYLKEIFYMWEIHLNLITF